MKSEVRIVPFKDIWFKPRLTMRAILDSDKFVNVKLFILISSIVHGANGGINQFLERNNDLVAGLIVGILTIVLAYPITYYIFPKIIRWTGKLFDAKNDLDDIRCYLGWSSFIGIIYSLLMFVVNLTSGTQVNIFISSLVLGLAIFVLIINLKLLAEVQQFSAWKALGNLLCSIITLFFIIFIPLLILITIFSIITKL